MPKPGTNKWRPVIDYRYVNTQLRGCEFPVPVIEDWFVKQAGNQLWTVLNLEDGFEQRFEFEDCICFNRKSFKSNRIQAAGENCRKSAATAARAPD